MKLKRRSSRAQQEIELEYSKPNRNNKGRLFDGTTLRMLLLPSPYRRRLRYRQSKSKTKHEIDLEDEVDVAILSPGDRMVSELFRCRCRRKAAMQR